MSADALAHVQRLAQIITTLPVNKAWGSEDVESWMISRFSSIRILGSKSCDNNDSKKFVATIESLKNNLTEALDAIKNIQADVTCNQTTVRDLKEEGLQRLSDNILARIFEYGNEIDDVNYWEHDGESGGYSDSDFSSDTSEEGEGEVNKRRTKKIRKYTYDSGNIGPFAVRISQVNRRFRSLALRIPKIWSTLQTEDTFYRTRMFLERSKDTGLTIHFMYCPHFKRFLKMVLKHRKRWSSVIFEPIDWKRYGDWAGDFVYENYCAGFPQTLSLPRLVEIDCVFPTSVDMPETPYANWEMPQLKRLETSDTQMNDSWLKGLTELSLYIRAQKYDEARRLGDLSLIFAKLSSCKILKVSFDWNECQSYPEFKKGAKSLLFLQSLSIEISHKTQLKILEKFLHYCIPIEQLSELEFHVDNGIKLEDLTVLYYPGYNFTELRKLRLEFINSDAKGNILRQQVDYKYDAKKMPSLESIEILHASNPKVIFTHLPSIKSIIFRDCIELQQDQLEDMVRKLADSSVAPSFKSLQILGCKISDQTADRLKELFPTRVIIA